MLRLERATGSAPERPVRGSTVGDPFAHPEVFLHPAQRQVVERSFRGQDGYTPHEMGVFVRSKAELDRAIADG